MAETETKDLNQKVSALEKALEREKAARKMAETLLEQRSREIFESNQSLQTQMNEAKLQQLQLSFLTGLSADIWNADSVNNIVQVYLRRSSEFLNNAQCMFFQLRDEKTHWKLSSVMELENKYQQNDIDKEKIKTLIKSFQVDALLEAVKDAGGESTLQPVIAFTDESSEFQYIYIVPIFDINDNRGFASYLYSDHTQIDVLKLQTVESSRSMLAVAIQRQLATVNLNNRFKELKKTYKKLDDAQKQLVQSERMASIGQLAAGVAHEINNPIGFILSNYETLAEYIEVLNNILELYPNLAEQEAQNKLNQIWHDEDVDYIKEDLKELLSASKGGLKRVQEIVAGLKSFSHSNESADLTSFNLNECIEDSINLVWNELKYNCTIDRKFDDNLAPIKGSSGQIAQVIVNMLINAKHAMDSGGTITVQTQNIDDKVQVAITDQGCGISEENLEKLFTPFFTTKPVGVGTGLGLCISYGILKDHHAEIDVQSKVGEGTTFTILFPAYSE